MAHPKSLTWTGLRKLSLKFGSLSQGLDHIDADRSEAGITSDDVPGLPLVGGFNTLQTLANVPKTWPLARLTIPLVGFSKQLERLLRGYCMEIIATNAYPEQHIWCFFSPFIWLKESLHSSDRCWIIPARCFIWLLPNYRELVNTASRCRPSRASERS